MKTCPSCKNSYDEANLSFTNDPSDEGICNGSCRSKKQTLIIVEMDDGSRYEISGDALKAYQENMRNASIHFGNHGNTFKDVRWRKL